MWNDCDYFVTVAEQSIEMSLFVCLSMCISMNCMSEPYQIFCSRHMWPWLGPLGINVLSFMDDVFSLCGPQGGVMLVQ